MNTLRAGGLAGALATLPLTMAMTALHRILPKHERYPLPPELITRSLIGRAQTRVKLSEPELNALTLLAHFGYGAASGTRRR